MLLTGTYFLYLKISQDFLVREIFLSVKGHRVFNSAGHSTKVYLYYITLLNPNFLRFVCCKYSQW